MAKSKSLDKFKKISLKIDIDKIAQKNAEKCAKQINDNIQSEGWTGNYAGSWLVSVRGNKSTQYWVHTTEYRLAHLLENGHLIVNKKAGVGWSPAIEHIRPAFAYVRDKYIKEAKKVDINAKIE